MKATATVCLLTVVALLPSTLVVGQTEAPRIERPVWPPTGSTWTVQTKSTGSLGSGSSTATWQALGEQDWEGRRVMGLSPGGGFHLYYDANRRIVAQVRRGSHDSSRCVQDLSNPPRRVRRSLYRVVQS